MNALKSNFFFPSKVIIATVICVGLIVVWVAMPIQAASNVFNISPVTVTKITHVCGRDLPPDRNLVVDYLVSFDGARGTPAQPFTANFSGVPNPVVVYTLQAPPGKRFVVDPKGNPANFYFTLGFNDGVAGDSSNHIPTEVLSYQNLIGVAPTALIFYKVPPASISDNAHNVFVVGITEESFSGPISFTGLTLSAHNTFTPGGSGSRTYAPVGGGIEARYTTQAPCDPGPFVSLQDIPLPAEVPEADTLLLLGGGLGGLATWLGWQWKRLKRK